jgi:hypothetical protein
LRTVAANKISLSAIIFGLSVISGCTKKDPAPSGATCTLTTSTYNDENSYSTTQYIYDDQKRIIGQFASGVKPTIYTYNSEGLVTSVAQGSLTQTWNYDGSQLLSTRILDSSIYSGIAAITYLYSFHGNYSRLDGYRFTYAETCCGSELDIAFFTYNGKNIASVILTQQSTSIFGQVDTQTDSTVYEYDEKNNPSLLVGAALGGQIFYPSYNPPDPSDISKNNITKMIRTIRGYKYTTNIYYEYNSEGFPTKSTSLETDGTRSTIQTYSYGNCP